MPLYRGLSLQEKWFQGYTRLLFFSEWHLHNVLQRGEFRWAAEMHHALLQMSYWATLCLCSLFDVRFSRHESIHNITFSFQIKPWVMYTVLCKNFLPAVTKCCKLKIPSEKEGINSLFLFIYFFQTKWINGRKIWTESIFGVTTLCFQNSIIPLGIFAHSLKELSWLVVLNILENLPQIFCGCWLPQIRLSHCRIPDRLHDIKMMIVFIDIDCMFGVVVLL